MANNLAKYVIDNMVDDVSNGKFYIAVGEHNQPASNTESNLYKHTRDVRNNLIFGKKVKTDDFLPIVKKNVWTSNTVYERADNQVDSEHYIINQNNDVFKCVWNNGGEVSTSEPITKSNTLIETSDGYVWKYMYTVSSSEATKFIFTNYMPVSSNATVEAASVNNSIDYVSVANTGQGYTVHNEGTVTSALSSVLYKISSDASTVNNIYANSSFYVKNGTSAGELFEVYSSFSNSSGNYVTFASNTVLSTDSEYIISPKVVVNDIAGSGFSAYSIIENDSISEINVIDAGSDYIEPTISLVSSGTPTSAANLEPILSPEGGHGKNPISELNATKGAFVTTLLNAEDETLPTDMTYYNAALVYNPTTDVSEQNTASWGLSANVAETFAVNDKITGESSNASGVVYWANTSHVKINNIRGTFSNGESIINESSTNSSINIIKSNDVTSSTGDIVKYNITFDGIDRGSNISEDIKFIINLESN